MQQILQRNDEIDAAARLKLARVIRDEPQEYTSGENCMLDRVRTALVSLSGGTTKILKSPDHFVQMRTIFVEGDSMFIMMADTTIDESIEHIVAQETSKMSRADRIRHFKQHGLERSLTALNGHSGIFQFTRDLKIPRLAPREWKLHCIWKWNADKSGLVIAYETMQDPPYNPICVRTDSTIMLTLKQLPALSGIPQTQVTYTARLDIRAPLPKWVVAKQAPKQLMYLSGMRNRFDKSAVIDSASRARIVEMIKNHTAEYTDKEDVIVKDALGYFGLFEKEDAKPVNMKSSLTKAKKAFRPQDGHAWGWAKTVVRASSEDILSFSWDTMSRGKQRDDDLEKALDEIHSDHSHLLYNRKATPKIVQDRDFLSLVIWKATATGYVLATLPATSDARPLLPGIARASYPSVMRIKRLSTTRTEIEYVIHPDWGGRVPNWISRLYIGVNLRRVTEIQEFFQSLRRLEQWDEEDSKTVGEIIVTETKAEKHHEKGGTKYDARVQELFGKYKGLKEIGAKYDFMEGMLARVLQNKLLSASDVNAKLCNLSQRQGGIIGAGLAMSLASSLTAEAAVDEWIGKYPALKELDREAIWFRPMLDTVALRLLGEVSWGLKMRVFMGAGLSILDMASDINVIVLYTSSSDTAGYGMSLLGMLFACIAVQLLVVFAQNKAKPRKLLREALIVLTGLKPG
jgi:hypothetical protein